MIVSKIITNKGEISLRLFEDKAPVTVSNFIYLSQNKFYKNLTFHRVIDDFMIQAGCPIGDGTGGPGYTFSDEFNDQLKHNKPGILSMANCGPDTNGSQFFITHKATPWLDNNHAVFGEVLHEESMEVVNNITQGDKILSIDIEGDYAKLQDKNKDYIAHWDEAAK